MLCPKKHFSAFLVLESTLKLEADTGVYLYDSIEESKNYWAFCTKSLVNFFFFAIILLLKMCCFWTYKLHVISFLKNYFLTPWNITSSLFSNYCCIIIFILLLMLISILLYHRIVSIKLFLKEKNNSSSQRSHLHKSKRVLMLIRYGFRLGSRKLQV